MTDYIPKYKYVAWLLLGVFWLLGCFAYPLQELVPDAYASVNTYIYLLGDALIILIGIWTLRARIDIILLVSLLIISIASMIVNSQTIIEYLNGMRFYAIVVFILSTLRYLLATRTRLEYFIPLFEKSLYIFLLIQFPVMVQQCIRWGAYDNVGGSLGWMMSGAISTLLYVISFYLMLRRWDSDKSYGANLKQNWMLLVLLIPSMLNETKISFIYMLLYFLLLVPFDRKFINRLLIIAPITLSIIIGAISIYNKVQDNPFDTSKAEGLSVSEYVFGQDDIREAVLDGTVENLIPYIEDEVGDLARGVKFAALPIVIQSSPHALWLGFGPSQFKGGNVLEETDFTKEFKWMIQGTFISVIMYQIDLGLLGVLWLIFYIIVLFRAFRHVKFREKRLMIFMAIIFVLDYLYMSAHILQTFMIVFTYIIMMSSRWSLCKYVPQPTGWLLPPIDSIKLNNPENGNDSCAST